MTTTLVPIDGSQSSIEAAKYAVRSRPHDDLVLLYVAPSGRPVDMERGRFLLDHGRRVCEGLTRGRRVSTRLEVGDRQTKLSQVAAEENCGLVVMSAHGVNATPHVDRGPRDTSRLTEDLQRPVVLVLPTGQGIRTDIPDSEVDDREEAFVP
jgi:nucleotide-binding universal stress UspA family protein